MALARVHEEGGGDQQQRDEVLLAGQPGHRLGVHRVQREQPGGGLGHGRGQRPAEIRAHEEGSGDVEQEAGRAQGDGEGPNSLSSSQTRVSRTGQVLGAELVAVSAPEKSVQMARRAPVAVQTGLSRISQSSS